MKLNKLIAFGASLILFSSCVSLPVSAVSKKSIDVVVYSIGGDTSDPWHSWYRVIGEYGQTYAINGFQLAKWHPSPSMEEIQIQLGDILTCEGLSWQVLEDTKTQTVISPASSEYSVSVTGSVFDNPETKTYKVTDFAIEETTFDDNETYHLLHCNLTPQFNETKKKYFPFDLYLERERCAPTGYVDWFSLQEDDIVSCITYGISPVFITEKVEFSATGDADRNDTLDILDVITVNKVIMGKEELDPEIIPLIDFNQNGKPDADDALTMLKKIVGLS